MKDLPKKENWFQSFSWWFVLDTTPLEVVFGKDLLSRRTELCGVRDQKLGWPSQEL